MVLDYVRAIWLRFGLDIPLLPLLEPNVVSEHK